MPIDDDIKDIRNDIERVKQDIDSINRTQVLANTAVILQDIRDAVGKSKQMVAALFLTRIWISSGDLAAQLKIDQANLNKVVNRLHDRGLLYREKDGKTVKYKRVSRVDLVGFDGQQEFKQIYEAWQKDSAE
jgi:MarR family